jgi:hypothetical protein
MLYELLHKFYKVMEIVLPLLEWRVMTEVEIGDSLVKCILLRIQLAQLLQSHQIVTHHQEQDHLPQIQLLYHLPKRTEILLILQLSRHHPHQLNHVIRSFSPERIQLNNKVVEEQGPQHLIKNVLIHSKIIALVLYLLLLPQIAVKIELLHRKTRILLLPIHLMEMLYRLQHLFLDQALRHCQRACSGRGTGVRKGREWRTIVRGYWLVRGRLHSLHRTSLSMWTFLLARLAHL